MKKTIRLSVVSILAVCLVAFGYSKSISKEEMLRAEINASQVAFQTQESKYKKELDKLKLMLSSNKSTLTQRDNQINKIRFEEIKKDNLFKELISVRNKKVVPKVQITKADKPNLSNTKSISKIDVDVVNSKFKDGVLKNKGQLMIDTALKYNINPHFFCALIALESNYGKSKLARTKFNLGGIKGGKTYRGFNSTAECLDYMGSLLHRKYHNQGLVMIDRIHRRYAPPAHGNKGWDKKIQSIMLRLHNEALS